MRITLNQNSRAEEDIISQKHQHGVSHFDCDETTCGSSLIKTLPSTPDL